MAWSDEEMATAHVGRSWVGTALEDNCPCDKAPCGLATNVWNSDCDQHGPHAARTMRQGHKASECSGHPK